MFTPASRGEGRREGEERGGEESGGAPLPGEQGRPCRRSYLFNEVSLSWRASGGERAARRARGSAARRGPRSDGGSCAPEESGGVRPGRAGPRRQRPGQSRRGRERTPLLLPELLAGPPAAAPLCPPVRPHGRTLLPSGSAGGRPPALCSPRAAAPPAPLARSSGRRCPWEIFAGKANPASRLLPLSCSPALSSPSRCSYALSSLQSACLRFPFRKALSPYR